MISNHSFHFIQTYSSLDLPKGAKWFLYRVSIPHPFGLIGTPWKVLVFNWQFLTRSFERFISKLTHHGTIRKPTETVFVAGCPVDDVPKMEGAKWKLLLFGGEDAALLDLPSGKLT